MRKVLSDLVTPAPPPGAPAKKDAAKPSPITVGKDSKSTASPVSKPPRSGPFFAYKGSQTYGLVRRERLIALFLGIPKGSETAISDEIFRSFRVAWPDPSATVPVATPPAPGPAPAAPAASPPARPPGPWR